MTFSALAFAACCTTLAFMFWRGRARRTVSKLEVILACIAPALLIVACLAEAYGHQRFGEIRLTVQGASADLADAPLRVGGDRTKDDLPISGIGGAVLEASLAAGQDGEDQGDRSVLLEVVPDTSSGAPMAVAIKRRAGFVGAPKPAFLGSQPLAAGDAFCVGDCKAQGAKWYVLSSDRRLVPARVHGEDIRAIDPAGAASPQMPTRRVLRYISGVAYWPAAQAIHPLRDFLPPQDGAVDSQPDSPCGRTQYCVRTPAGIAPAKGFLFQDGGLFGAQWRLMSPDQEGLIAPKGSLAKASPVGGAIEFEGEPGASVTVSAWEIRFFDIDGAEPNAPRGKLVERRAFTITPDSGGSIGVHSARIRLETPEIQVIGGCANPSDIPPAQYVTSAADVSGRALTLSALGGRLGQATTGALPLPSNECVNLDRLDFQLGSLEGDGRSARLRLERLGFPWMMIWIATAWALVSALAQGVVARSDRNLWMLLALAQVLLAMRWLVALAGAAADPKLDWPGMMQGCAIAYVVAPAAFLLTTKPDPKLWPTWSMIGLFVAGAVAAQVLSAGRPDAVTLMLLAGFSGLLAFQALGASQRSAHATVALTERVKRGVARIAGGIPKAAPGWALLLGAVIGVRLILGFLGMKERVGLAISVFYTPLLILGFAWLLERGQHAGASLAVGNFTIPRRTWHGLAFTVFWGAAALAPVLVFDVGYVITLAPVAFFATAYFYRRKAASADAGEVQAGWDGTYVRSFPSALIAILFIVPLLIAPLTSCGLDPQKVRSAAMARDDAPALEILRKQASYDQNILRLALLAAPDQLSSAGTREAENLRAWSVHLASYTGSLLGRGYMSPSKLSPILLPVQLNDNVSAIHLMSPFGRFGAVVLLLLLAAAPVAGARALRLPAGAPRSTSQIAGLMSLWVMFGVAAYIILANLQLLPFTGRNIYLFASSSGSDLIEGLTLLAIARWGLKGGQT